MCVCGYLWLHGFAASQRRRCGRLPAIGPRSRCRGGAPFETWLSVRTCVHVARRAQVDPSLTLVRQCLRGTSGDTRTQLVACTQLWHGSSMLRPEPSGFSDPFDDAGPEGGRSASTTEPVSESRGAAGAPGPNSGKGGFKAKLRQVQAALDRLYQDAAKQWDRHFAMHAGPLTKARAISLSVAAFLLLLMMVSVASSGGAPEAVALDAAGGVEQAEITADTGGALGGAARRTEVAKNTVAQAAEASSDPEQRVAQVSADYAARVSAVGPQCEKQCRQDSKEMCDSNGDDSVCFKFIHKMPM